MILIEFMAIEIPEQTCESFETSFCLSLYISLFVPRLEHRLVFIQALKQATEATSTSRLFLEINRRFKMAKRT